MKKQFLMALAALSLLGGRMTAQEPACKPPLMGWSSWNAYRVNISEDIIKHQADLMVEKGLKDAGYRFINIDDGFFGYRDETGKSISGVPTRTYARVAMQRSRRQRTHWWG